MLVGAHTILQHLQLLEVKCEFQCSILINGLGEDDYAQDYGGLAYAAFAATRIGILRSASGGEEEP